MAFCVPAKINQEYAWSSETRKARMLFFLELASVDYPESCTLRLADIII